MDDIEKLIRQVVLEWTSKRALSDEEAAKLAAQTLEHTLPEITKNLARTLRKKAPAMLRDRRSGVKAFEKRHFALWRKGIDLLETVIVMAEEAGSQFNDHHRPTAANSGDLVFDLLIHLHARAVLIAREVLCLIKGGFADGALARWRSLHEVTVVLLVVSKADNLIAERYYRSHAIQAHKAQVQYNNYAERANLQSIDEETHEIASHEKERILAEYGAEMAHEYGWAAPLIGKAKPTFFDLEEWVGLDHWRPYYKWASQYNHANFKPHATLLGLSGGNKEERILLVGQSNFGMTDPAQLTAQSLSMATECTLLHRPNVDRCVYAAIISDFADEVGPTFMEIQNFMDAQEG